MFTCYYPSQRGREGGAKVGTLRKEGRHPAGVFHNESAQKIIAIYLHVKKICIEIVPLGDSLCFLIIFEKRSFLKKLIVIHYLWSFQTEILIIIGGQSILQSQQCFKDKAK